MNSNIRTSKIVLSILFILAIISNSWSQTTIYATGFDNITTGTIFGYKASLTDDYWVVNDMSVQEHYFRCEYGLGNKMDSLRNTWCLSAIDNPFNQPDTNFWAITGNSLGICALSGPNSFFISDDYLDCNKNPYIRTGYFDYYSDLATDRWAYRVIPTTGYKNITLSFQWKCKGIPDTAYGQVGYSLDSGKTWNWLTSGGCSNTGKYYGCYSPIKTAKSQSLNLPAECSNQNGFALGFRFTAIPKTDSVGYGPTFIVDNVYIKGDTIICNGVTIKTQPNNISVCSSGFTNFSVTATGDGTISYQWQVGTAWTDLSNNSMYNGVTSPALTVTNPNATLQYRCIASNCSPVVYATSNAATLTLINLVGVNPSFYNQDQCIGDSVGYTINLTSGTGPYSYQWLLNGNPVKDGSGGTTDLFFNKSISKSDTGIYSCIVTNVCNSVTGEVVSLSLIGNCDRTHHKINGYVTYDNKAKTPLSSKTALTTTNVLLYNSGDTLISATQTNDAGYYEFVNIINGNYFLSGFSKKTWGGSNPTDALIVNRNYIGMYNFSDSLLYHAGDVDSNNRLTPTDALIINRRYIGVLTQYPKVMDWKFQKIKINMAGDNLSQNLLAVCSGDVNASYASYLIPGKMIYTPVNTSGTLNISPSLNPSPSPFNIPVYLNDNAELGAIGIKLLITNYKLQIIGIKSNLSGLIYNITNDGVNVAWSAINEGYNISPDKPLFYITAIYKGEPNLSGFQLPASSFQLSGESEIADINVNLINTDKITIPNLIFNIQHSTFNIRNYPNPFNNITNIEYVIPEDLNVKMDVYNVLGENIITLVNGYQKAGQYNLKFDGSALKKGIYYCRIIVTNSNSSFNKTDIFMIAR